MGGQHVCFEWGWGSMSVWKAKGRARRPLRWALVISAWTQHDVHRPTASLPECNLRPRLAECEVSRWSAPRSSDPSQAEMGATDTKQDLQPLFVIVLNPHPRTFSHRFLEIVKGRGRP